MAYGVGNWLRHAVTENQQASTNWTDKWTNKREGSVSAIAIQREIGEVSRQIAAAKYAVTRLSAFCLFIKQKVYRKKHIKLSFMTYII